MRQISIISEKRPDFIRHITGLLAEPEINIFDLDAESVNGKEIMVLTVDRYEEALSLLAQQGLETSTDEILSVEAVDRPGALARIAITLTDAGVNIRCARIIRRDNGTCTINLVVSDLVQARSLLYPTVGKSGESA